MGRGRGASWRACLAPQPRTNFGIGDERLMVCGISFGYAQTDHPVNGFRTGRAPMDQIMRIVLSC